jgi:hypothetical protein
VLNDGFGLIRHSSNSLAFCVTPNGAPCHVVCVEPAEGTQQS